MTNPDTGSFLLFTLNSIPLCFDVTALLGQTISPSAARLSHSGPAWNPADFGVLGLRGLPGRDPKIHYAARQADGLDTDRMKAAI